MDVTVVIATYGDDTWADLAKERALPSAIATGKPYVIQHSRYADNPAAARNHALSMVRTEWVCHLDADDELEPGYFDAMNLATADVRAPSVRYVDHRHAWSARLPRVAGHDHDCTAECLAEGNWLVVGTLVRADLIRAVGGWRDFTVYEDYDLWLRCWQAGATIEPVPDAIYRAYVRPDSRNRGQLAPAAKHAVHQAIARANGLPVPV